MDLKRADAQRRRSKVRILERRTVAFRPPASVDALETRKQVRPRVADFSARGFPGSGEREQEIWLSHLRIHARVEHERGLPAVEGHVLDLRVEQMLIDGNASIACRQDGEHSER